MKQDTQSKPRYTCSMHPEVRSNKPGKCPKCGMALVLMDEMSRGDGVEDHSSHDHMQHHVMMAEDFKRRFLVALPLTILILVLSPQIQQWLGISIDFPFRGFLLFIFGTVMVVYGGKPFFAAARGELSSRNYGMMTLVSLAIGAGYIFSIAATFLFPGESLWWEISTLVLVFLFGHWMEMRAVIGTGGALKELAKLIPPIAHKLVGGEAKDIATEELKKGDLVLIRPGEKVPADGIIMEGSSAINESMITGESKPVPKKEGDTVIGGTINGDGSLTVKITKVGKDSALSQIMELVRGAQETKPAVQALADRAANYLTLVAITIGSGTFLYWMFINPHGAIFAATLAITVVVIACPHALGLAIPTVTTIATSLAAKNGILIRDMKGLEAIKNTDYIVFDKTGTLTTGDFGVSKILAFANSSDSEILALAASVEAHSEHPLARAIVNYAKAKKITFKEAKKFKAIKGKGAVATVGGSRIAVGNASLLESLKISPQNIDTPGSIAYVAKGDSLLGAIVLEDKIRSESQEAIKTIHEMGIKVAMLTGDKREVAEEVGSQLGIDKVFAQVLPEDKIDKVKSLQSEGYTVAMVGDGVNDAPALAQANVGIAIGAGTSVAIESAEVVLVKSNPADIVKTINLARKTNSKMKQNLAWATGYNLFAIPLAAGVLYPWGFTLRPEWGALLMSASSVIVVFNALRLRLVKL